MKRITLPWALLLALPIWLPARQEPSVCGTHSDTWREELHLHRQSTRALRTTGKLRLYELQAAAARDAGNIALLEDAGGVVARPNAFNLDQRTVTFHPTAPTAVRYRFEAGPASYSADLAAAGTPVRGLTDDDSRMFTLPFEFPFYGSTHKSVFLNSDGNLTFNGGDTASDSRSLGRLAAGHPRIAALFRDLDPTQAAEGVRVLSTPGSFVVSWVSVPQFNRIGGGPGHTFQIRLFPDGRIELAWSGIPTGAAVVGIAPGRLQGASAIVSFTGGSTEEYSAAIAESFGSVLQVDTVRAAQRFYETHDDAYDYLIFYNNLGIEARDGAVAYEVTVRSDRTGYGDMPVDAGAAYGSPRRLQAVINMGPLSQYSRDPRAPVPLRASTGDNALTVIAHEVGHLFLAFASVRDPLNANARPMLGFQSAHWNFNFNSEASLLEGNRILDRGPGQQPRFETIATVEGYSPLDQYLMGFRPPEEVPPTFLVENSPRSGAPRVGVQFDGTRRDVTVEEIIAAEGRRTPDHTVSQRRFRAAFILITAAGADPSTEQIEQLDRYRREFEAFFHSAASGRAVVETTLAQAVNLSLWPAAGVLSGSTAMAKVSLARPAATPLTLQLSSDNGAAEPPATVTIPQGATETSFQVRGVRPGVSEITARIDDSFEMPAAKLQVSATPEALDVIPVSGFNQIVSAGVPLAEPVVLRVVDRNRLPYAGRRVQVNVAAGGSVEPAEAVTDENGNVAFHWTPSANPLNELYASVEGSSRPPVTVTALGPPAVASDGIVSSASYRPGLTPNGLATIFGANLAAGATLFASGFTDTVAGVQVLVNGTPAPLVFVSDRQINFWVPQNLATGAAEITVLTPLGSSQGLRVPVTSVQPGIFFDSASGFGAILVAGTGKTTLENPVQPGEYIEIYGTGLGPVRGAAVFGPQPTTSTPQATVAGRPALVTYSGLAPGYNGLYQVNVQIPADTPSGDATVVLTIDGQQSNEVRIRIR